MATDPSGLKELDLGSPEANDLAQVPQGPQLKAALAADPAFVGFYVGNQDSRFYQPNVVYDAALTRAGVSHLFRIYQAGHDTSLWHAEAPVWLGYAVDALARGPVVGLPGTLCLKGRGPGAAGRGRRNRCVALRREIPRTAG